MGHADWVAVAVTAFAPLPWAYPTEAGDRLEEPADPSSGEAPASLLGLVLDSDFFRLIRPTSAPPAAPTGRNPFVLPAEVEAGKPYTMLKRERDQRDEAARRALADQERSQREAPVSSAEPPLNGPEAPPPVDRSLEEAEARIGALRLTAVLIGAAGATGTAIIDGRIIDVGEPVAGEEIVLDAVSREGVTLRFREHRYSVRLPAPKAAREGVSNEVLRVEAETESEEGE